MLDTQIQIYSVDTGNFYSDKEARLHKLNHKLRLQRKNIVDDLKEIEKTFSDCGIDKEHIDNSVPSDLLKLADKYLSLKNKVAVKNKRIKMIKDCLLQLLSDAVEANIESDGKHHIRELNENDVSKKNIISVFESYFTRTIGAKQDELCEDFMVVQVYYFDVIKDLIYYGFTYKGEKYIYFTSSAGQIRTKKCVFIKESVWNKHEKTLMCGLTIDDINAKGGNNPNKHLAYLALTNSATDVWEEFDIDKTIVIDDFETEVEGEYDLVDDITYSIKRIEDGYVPITHTDGAGMMLPCMGKNRMVRLPWVKGLLGVFDFRKFIETYECSSIIKDIYGKEHDIIAEDIQIIFTKSQFKMHKYYDSWDDYKEKYKKYGCTAGMTNVEEDRIKNATINYQMLQSLTNITDDEIRSIAKKSINKLENICSSIDNIKDAFGITPYNTNKTAFQKSVELYPNLLNDEYVKSQLRDIKDSMVKKYKSGKLEVNGKYTFLLPDFYAACQYWFMGIENPNGLLEDGEVFCWLFRKSDKLDCLRSPHLYKEHAVRKNIAWCEYEDRQQELREWFCTDAVYTSCHDLISKILQFDVDGDKSLVVADKTIVDVAEKNMENIVPLYYNMKKAEPIILNNASIYNGLNAAFVGGNIGIYSNNISKIWNSDVFVSGTDEEKKQATDVVKLLCMENNFVIDYAKTLYKPERPSKIKKLITSHTKEQLPHFFEYAKDKKENQVSDVNGSFVNKLDSIITNPRINFRKLGKPSIFAFFENEISSIEKILDKRISNAKTKQQKKTALRNKMLFIIGVNVDIDDEEIRTLKWSFFFDDCEDRKKTYDSNENRKKRFNADVISIIDTYVSEYPIDNFDDYMFSSRKGNEAISMNSIKRIINELSKEAKVERRIEEVDYTFLMSNPEIECKVVFAENGKIDEEKTDPLIVKYCELNSKHHFSLENAMKASNYALFDSVRKSQMRQELKSQNATNEIRYELSQFGYSDEEVADILVKFLYDVKKSKYKVALWTCYGDYILNNLEKYFKPQTKAVQCIDCGEWFEVGIFDSATERCRECYKEYRKKYKALKERERREKQKSI